MNKGHKRVLVIIFVLIFIAAVLAVLSFMFNNNRTAIEVEIIDSIPEYGYSINNFDGDYYVEEFRELKNILSTSVDRELYVRQLAKLFAIDLYSIDTKVNKYDVGGKEYYHESKVEMYTTKVIDTFYNYLVDNTYGDREQDLPMVSEAIVSSYSTDTYLLGDEEVDSYIVVIELKYEEELGYDKLIEVTLVDNDKKIEVVESKPVEEDIS